MKLKFQIAVIFWSCMMTISCGVKTNRQIPIESSEVLSNENKKKSIVQVFKENQHLSMEDRIELFYKLKRDSLDNYDFENEGDLNFYGYQLLWNDKDQEAYLIFKMIVSEFPNSSNAYDSFGEICLKMGDKKEALINYKKSLELNPDNFNAEDQIAYILDPSKKPESPSDKFTKIHTVHEYLEDLDQLASKIISTHPNVFKFTSESDFRKLVEEKKKEITQLTTFGEFIWHCDEIIASVNCSHTSISGFYLEHAMLPAALSFPLQTRWVNDRLFIIDPMNNANKVTVKSEITSINGVPTVELIKDIYKHLPSQGHIETTKRHLFNKWSTCFIPYALKFPETFTITLKDSVNPIVLNKANEKTILHKDPSIQHCEKDMCLDFYHNDNTAILTIETFNYYRFQNTYAFFKEFIDSCFVEINSKKSKNLIIDVRQNGGGSQSASIHLLRYLVDKPLTYYSHVDFEGKNGPVEGEEMVMPYEDRYKGKVYFLIDGVGNSTTGHFMSIAKVLNLGTIIGEELGSNQFCSAGGKMLRLSHTKLVYSVADNTHVSMATSLPDETGILPDVYIEQSIDDYLGEIDVVKEYTLNLISKNEE